MEIDYSSIFSAASGGVWNAIFGATGVCLFALLVSRIELVFQNISLKATTIAYQGPKITRGLSIMALGLLGLVLSLAAIWMRTHGANLADGFSKALASPDAIATVLLLLVGATALLFDFGALVYLGSEQRQGAR